MLAAAVGQARVDRVARVLVGMAWVELGLWRYHALAVAVSRWTLDGSWRPRVVVASGGSASVKASARAIVVAVRIVAYN